MAKDKPEAEGAPPSAPAQQPVVRRARYIGVHGRGFDSAPFGSRIVCASGCFYDFGEEFKYLWEDTNFNVMFEWDPPETPVK